MTDATAKKTLDDYLDAALEGGEKMVTLPTSLLLALWSDASGGVAAAREVVANWSGGDLAGAVNNLEEWADAMVETYADMEETEEDEADTDPPVDPDLGLVDQFTPVRITDARPWSAQHGKVAPGFYYLDADDALVGPYATYGDAETEAGKARV